MAGTAAPKGAKRQSPLPIATEKQRSAAAIQRDEVRRIAMNIAKLPGKGCPLFPQKRTP
jgi:hypothetical protein